MLFSFVDYYLLMVYFTSNKGEVHCADDNCGAIN